MSLSQLADTDRYDFDGLTLDRSAPLEAIVGANMGEDLSENVSDSAAMATLVKAINI